MYRHLATLLLCSICSFTGLTSIGAVGDFYPSTATLDLGGPGSVVQFTGPLTLETIGDEAGLHIVRGTSASVGEITSDPDTGLVGGETYYTDVYQAYGDTGILDPSNVVMLLTVHHSYGAGDGVINEFYDYNFVGRLTADGAMQVLSGDVVQWASGSSIAAALPEPGGLAALGFPFLISLLSRSKRSESSSSSSSAVTSPSL